MNYSLRTLKFLVIIMGIAIVTGTAVVVVTILQRAGEAWSNNASPEEVDRTSSLVSGRADFGVRTIYVPRSSRVAEIIAENDRLILRVERADGMQDIVLVDANTGARLGKLEVREAP